VDTFLFNFCETDILGVEDHVSVRAELDPKYEEEIVIQKDLLKNKEEDIQKLHVAKEIKQSELEGINVSIKDLKYDLEANYSLLADKQVLADDMVLEIVSLVDMFE